LCIAQERIREKGTQKAKEANDAAGTFAQVSCRAALSASLRFLNEHLDLSILLRQISSSGFRCVGIALHHNIYVALAGGLYVFACNNS